MYNHAVSWFTHRAVMIKFSPGNHLYFIGIGGVGLSAIARVLLEQGCQISGSDRAASPYSDALARDGAAIYIGHYAENLLKNSPDAVIISSAIKRNPEVEAAQARGIPVYKRADIIAGLMDGRTVIAVAGSHGKTTTTAMIAHILITTGREPGYIIGGTLKTTGTNAAAGAGNVFVIEADEYDHMFLGLRPNIAVVTNVEWDHPDFFKSADEFEDAFRRFSLLVPSDGALIGCSDDAGANRLLDWRGQQANTPKLIPYSSYEKRGVVFNRAIPGEHTAVNELAAIKAVERLGVSKVESAAALRTFEGVARRFEILGDIGGIVVIDDYAHNPTKIRAVLSASRSRYPDREIWAIWQPHTYSRTRTFLDQYAESFHDADHVIVTEIYAAREQPVEGVNGAATAEALHHPDARFASTFGEVLDRLIQGVRPPAVILTMSAGDASRIGMAYLNSVVKVNQT